MNDPEGPSRLIPEEYAAKLKNARARRTMQGERRLVTILFCDVTGSTAMAESLDPEDWAEIMDEAFDLLIAPVYRYEGTIARLMGDAILAFFGAPIAHEDDPERAVLAGLDILQNIQPFREKIRREYGGDFNIRVGINTGHVVVGEIGSDLAVEYTAMGDAVNLAARMEQTALPGSVQIAEATYQLIEPLFEFEAREPLDIKGKSQPVQAYRVVGRLESPGRLRGIRGLASPIIGRSRELQTLQDAVEDAKLGRGGLVLLTGQAGLGKSRLLDEIRGRYRLGAPESAFTTIEMSGLSYEASSPYGLFRRALVDYFGLSRRDTPEVAWKKISDSDRYSPLHIKDSVLISLRAMWQLIGIQQTGQTELLEGEEFKRQLFENYPSVWQQMASQKPLIILVDDLHWADPASAEMLVHLTQLADTDPILFVFAMRPDRQSPGWQIKLEGDTRYPHRFVEINILPLTAGESDSLVENLLSNARFPPDLMQIILDKTEGNPLFIEEVLRALIQEGVISRNAKSGAWQAAGSLSSFSMPDSLQTLLVSRIDRLDPSARRTLQMASVIGRTFFFRVLESVDEAPEGLTGRLNALQRGELIRESRRIPELEYAFIHELSREAAYRTILRRQRRNYHRLVGEAMEQLFRDQLEQEAHQLGHHFMEAADHEKAMNYYAMAGDRSGRIYANAEAIEHYNLALEAARKVADPAAVPDERWIHLYTRLGRLYEISNRLDDAISVYETLQGLGAERDSPAMELAAALPQAMIYTIPSEKMDPAKGQAMTERTLALARELNDPQAETRALWNQMMLHYNRRESFTGGIEIGEQAIALARRYDLKEQLAYLLNDITSYYLAIGEADKTLGMLKEARDLFEELDIKEMQADSAIGTGVMTIFMGQFERGLELVEEGRAISEAIGNTWGRAFASFASVFALLPRGEVGKALHQFEEAINLAELAEFWVPRSTGQAYVAHMIARLGDLPRAAELARAAEENARRIHTEVVYPSAVMAVLDVYSGRPQSALRKLETVIDRLDFDHFLPMGVSVSVLLESEIRLANEEFDRVLEIAEERLPHMLQMGLLLPAPELMLFKGRALRGLGDVESAGLAFQEARELARSTENRLLLWQILIDLADLQTGLDGVDAAQDTRQAARETIEYIAGQIVEPDLREAFLGLPQVASLFNGPRWGNL